jgi:hypothetical protein
MAARKLNRPPRARSSSEVARHARAAADAFKQARASRAAPPEEREDAGRAATGTRGTRADDQPA